jgi:hypothetical protein
MQFVTASLTAQRRSAISSTVGFNSAEKEDITARHTLSFAPLAGRRSFISLIIFFIFLYPIDKFFIFSIPERRTKRDKSGESDTMRTCVPIARQTSHLPIISPMPDESINLTSEKSSTKSSGFFSKSALSIPSLIGFAVWWSISHVGLAVSVLPFCERITSSFIFVSSPGVRTPFFTSCFLSTRIF